MVFDENSAYCLRSNGQNTVALESRQHITLFDGRAHVYNNNHRAGLHHTTSAQ